MADETQTPTTPETPAPTPAPEASAPPSPPEGDQPPAEAKEEKSKDSWAAYARKKAKLNAEREAFAQARREFDLQQAKLQEEIKAGKRAQELIAKLREDPDAVAEELGLDYDQWTRRRLHRGTDKAELERLRAELEKDRQERQKAREEDQMQAQKREAIETFEKAKAALFEAVNASCPELSLYEPSEILQSAAATEQQLYKDTGKWPTMSEVAAAMEDEVSKRHARIRAAAQKTEEKAEKKGGGARTLTNAAASERARPERELTMAERRALAIKYLEDADKKASLPFSLSE